MNTERRDTICSQCARTKRPTKAYLALLKFHNKPYVCQSCRESIAPPIDCGKLGVIR